jgi:hypothetical protein
MPLCARFGQISENGHLKWIGNKKIQAPVYVLKTLGHYRRAEAVLVKAET